MYSRVRSRIGLKKAGFKFLTLILISGNLNLISFSPAKAIGTGSCGSTLSSTSGISSTVTSSGSECIARFTVTAEGTTGTGTWTVPANVTQLQYLVVAGGGGGGGGQASEHGGGGGGAGGVLSGTLTISTSTLSISVGAGGNGGAANSRGTSGANSSLGATITATGGGAGGSYFSPANDPISGGSGGGAGSGQKTTGASGTAGQGNAGGSVTETLTNGRHGAGGGGAGGVGGSTTSAATYTTAAGAGGIGLQSSITGVNTYYGAGGGGGGSSGRGGGSSGGASGGSGIGGTGATYNGVSLVSAATAGTAGSGSGGGGGIGTGGSTASSGGAGGSGVVIIRYTPITNVDYALSLSGSSQYAAATTDASEFDISNAISIEAWIKPSATCTGNIVGKATSYFLYCNSGTLNYALGGASSWSGVDTGIKIGTNEWHHIALTRAASTAVVRIYLDGVLAYTGTADGAGTSALTNSNSPNLFNIGARNSGTTFFRGSIDEVRLYNTNISQAQIQSDMKTWGPANTSNLVAYYDFNEGTGTTLFNQVAGASSNTDLTISGSPTWSDIKSQSINGSNIVTTFSRSYLNAAGGWTVPSGVSSLDLLVVGGGGAGGSRAGGGGGAGGYVYSTAVTVTANSVESITVGSGGIGLAEAQGTNGTNSSFGTKRTALGGGGGGGALGADETLRKGLNGGSGGANAGSTTVVGQSIQASTYSYGVGFAGGLSPTGGNYWPAAGGGGAASAGSTPSAINANGKYGGRGGSGISDPIAGTTTCYATGGGGGIGYNSGYTDGIAGPGGNCGGVASPSGGAGTLGDVVGENGVANTGAGGGGSGWNDNVTSTYYAAGNVAGGNGGSGVVIVSYTAVSGSVSITGAQSLGNLQTADVSGITSSGTPAYQWSYSETLSGTYTNISGATATTYTPNDTNYIYLKFTATYTFSGISGNITKTATVGPLYAGYTTDSLKINLDASRTSSLASASTNWTSVSPGSSTISPAAFAVAPTAAVGSGVSNETLSGVNTLKFTGASSYLNYGNNSDTSNNGAAYSIDTWVRMSSYNSNLWNIFASKWFTDANRVGSSSVNEWHLGINGNYLNVWTNSCSNIRYTEKVFSSSDVGTWIHIGFTVNSSGLLKVYLNGRPSSTTGSNCGPTSKTGTLFVGDPYPTTGTGFTGNMSRFRTYGKALSDAEMLKNFNSEAPTFGATRTSQVISYAAGGGTGSAPTSPTSVNYGQTFTTPSNTYSRDNYKFTGWSDGTTTYQENTTYPSVGSVTGDIVLTATWQALTSRTITIDSSSYSSSYTITVTPPTLTSTPSAGTTDGTKSYSSSTSGVCTVNSSTGVVTFVATGTCTITASISSGTTYASATSSSISFTVSPSTYAITLGTITRVAGDTTSTITIATSPSASGTTVTLTSSPATGMRLKAGSLIASYGASTATLSGSGPYTFTMPAAAVTINAEFESINPAAAFYAEDYTAGSTTWTDRITSASGVAPTGGMTKATSPTSVVFAGKEVSNSDRVSGSIGSTAGTSAITVEMWVKLADSGSAQNASGSMLFSWTAAAGSSNYNIYHYSNKIGFNTFNAEVYGINSSSIEQNWKHLVFVMTNTGLVSSQKIYVDGVAQSLGYVFGSSSLTRSFNASGNFVLMDNPYSSNVWNAKGSLGLARIYKEELTAAHVLELYDATKGTYQLSAALTPTFGTPTPTADGFTVQISNYSNSYTWAGTATASGSVSISGTGLVTVTGVAPATSSTATITTTRTGYVDGSSDVTATSANGSALTPTFGTPTPTADGFTVQISNYSNSYTWAGIATASGSVSISGTGLVTVTGVAPATSSTATITTTRTGYENGSSTVTATSLVRYVVTYDATTNGGTAISPLTANFAVGSSALVLPTPVSRTGYSASGWYTTASTGGSKVGDAGGNYTPTSTITLYFRWSLDSYSVTYKKGSSGTGNDIVQTFTYGDSITLGGATTALIRPGYTISGWSTTDGGAETHALSASYSSASNLILYPVWSANTYTVTYDATTNGGTAISPATASYTVAGATITLATPTSRSGYTAKGWYDSPSGGTKIGNAGATNYAPTSDITLYFQWTAINYTVTYFGNSNDGGSVPTNSNTYNIGSTIVVSGNSNSLVRSGYSFAGWTDNSGGSGTIYTSGVGYTVGSSNVSFYAKWTPNTYTITYNSNGGSGTASASSDTYTTAGSTVTLPTIGSLSKTGYTFSGWSLTPSGSLLSDGFTTSANVTLYAKWTIKSITLTYDKGAASGSSIASWPANGVGNYNTTLTLGTPTSQVTISGGTYQFAGWKLSGSTLTYEAGTLYTLPDTDPTLIAQWVQVFEVSYIFNGGTSATGFSYDAQCVSGSRLCSNNQPIQADAAPSRAGYTFTGWRDQSGNPISAGDTFNVTINSYLLYAQWSAVNYTITYNSAGGASTPTQSPKQINQSFTVANAPIRTGYTFGGWSDGANTYGEAANYTVGTENITLTALWTPDVYTVSYDWNGGTGSSTSNTSYTVGNSAITLPLVGDHTKDGYEFNGWAISPSGSNVGTTFTPTSSTTLYALWRVGTFTITFNGNGGNVSTSSATVTNGSATELPTPTRSNYEFNGWYTAATGGTLVGAAAASHTPTQSRTLYAQWTQASLAGISPSALTRVGSITASSSVASSFSVSNAGSAVAVTVPAGALENGTIINFDLVGDFSRASSLISALNSYIVSIVVSWVAPDGSVRDTADGKPITVVISNSTIKSGTKVYSIVGSSVTLLGTAVVDGSVTVELTSDPEVVVATTKPDAPTNVTATSGDDKSSVVSWTSPASNGGSPITGYTVTASNGRTCTTTGATTCTVTNLNNGSSYTFTVTATNSIGQSVASSASAAATPGTTNTNGNSGNGNSGSGNSGSGNSGNGNSGNGNSGNANNSNGNAESGGKETQVTVERKGNKSTINWSGSNQVILIIENSKGETKTETVAGNDFTFITPKPGEGYKVSANSANGGGAIFKDYVVATPPTKPVTLFVAPKRIMENAASVKATWKATSSFEQFIVKAKPVNGKVITIITDKPTAKLNLLPGKRYTIQVTAVGYGDLKSKVLTKIYKVPKKN